MKSFAVILIAALVGFSSAAFLPVPNWSNLVQNVEAAVQNTVNTVETAAQNAATAAQAAAQNAANAAQAAAQNAINAAQAAAQNAASAAQAAVQNAENAAEAAVQNAENAAEAAVQNAENAAQAAAQAAETALEDAVAEVEAFNQEIVADVIEAIQKVESLDLCTVDSDSLDCCVTVRNMTVCSNVIANNGPEGLSLSYVLLVNNVTIFSRTIDTSTLPLTQCAPLPQVPSVQLCLTPFDLTLSKEEIGACFELSAQFNSQNILAVNLHCYQVANQTFSILPPRTGPIEAPVTLDTGFLPTPAPIVLPF